MFHIMYVFMSYNDKTSEECVMQYKNLVNETSMDTILGTLFLIIFQARRGLKQPHAYNALILQATSLDVKNIYSVYIKIARLAKEMMYQ